MYRGTHSARCTAGLAKCQLLRGGGMPGLVVFWGLVVHVVT